MYLLRKSVLWFQDRGKKTLHKYCSAKNDEIFLEERQNFVFIECYQMNRFQKESDPGPETRRLTLAFAHELLLNFKTFYEEDILSFPGTIRLREFQQDEILLVLL
jgi:hypothetical protein